MTFYYIQLVNLEGGKHIRIAQVSPGMVETEFAHVAHKDDPARAARSYSSMKCLEAKDIADNIMYILQAPPHVQIHDMLVRPTEQVF